VTRTLKHVSFTALILMAFIVLLLIMFRGFPVSDTRMIAFPDSIDDTTLLDALDKAGIKGSRGVSNIMVPISDFSRIVMVDVQEALSRTRKGDPRRTPLLDDLESSFYFTGPDTMQWRVVYIPSISSGSDAVIAQLLADYEEPWAWDAKLDTKRPVALWIPLLIWSLWLILRRNSHYRMEQLLYLMACLPILLQGTVEAFLVVVLLEAGVATCLPFIRARWVAKAALPVMPYFIPIIILTVMEPGLIVFLLLTFMLGGVVAYIYPRLKQCSQEKRIHQAPFFITLVPSTLKKNQLNVMRTIFIPISAFVFIFFFLNGSNIDNKKDGQAYSIERSLRPGAGESTKIIDNHLIYQFILTYGRLGEAKWGNDDYSLAYRYNEKEGKLSRMSPDPVSGGWSSIKNQIHAEIKEAYFILSERRPVRVALQ